MNINKEIEKKIKRNVTFINIIYWWNRILFPPAKAMFVLWTLSWVLSFPKDNEDSLSQKIITVLFGYFFMCGIADLIYASNKKRYLEYKIKITQKKIKRGQRIMYNVDTEKYKMQCKNKEEKNNKPEKTMSNISEKCHDMNEYMAQNEKLDSIDPYIIEAGRLFIDKGKASIGLMQRAFKINFNRAARIMDILEKMGVVGAESEAKPREILVTRYEYENIIENYQINANTLNQNKRNYSKERIPLYNNKFDYMEGQDFEYFCAELLKKNGFKNIEVTRGSGDHGIDILAEKDGITYAIQCKCYSSNIGNNAIQQAHTRKCLYHKDIAVVLTNRYFTAQAKEEAVVLGVKLWDRDKLVKMIDLET